MQNLINITNTLIGNEDVNSVNARELHKAIQAKRQFANWIKDRINKYGFIENQDYIIVTEHTQGRPLKEYYITLDMAKHLAMVENNDKGREIRQYFIEVEKDYRNSLLSQYASLDTHIRAGYKSQLSQKNKKISELQAKIQELEQEAIQNHEQIYAYNKMLDLSAELAKLSYLHQKTTEQMQKVQSYIEDLHRLIPSAKQISQKALEYYQQKIDFE